MKIEPNYETKMLAADAVIGKSSALCSLTDRLSSMTILQRSLYNTLVEFAQMLVEEGAV